MNALHNVPDGVIRGAALRAAGVSNHVIATRCRPSGPWQRVLPGIVLLTGGPPSRRQLLRAALAYAGPDSLITGLDALRAHGVEVPARSTVRLLVPAERRVSARTYLTVERSARLPRPHLIEGIAYAPPARAVLDQVRAERDHRLMRSVLLAALRAGVCTSAELRAELDAGNQRGSAAPRALLAALDREVLPIWLGLARRLVRAAPLPEPWWGARLTAHDGAPLGTADAWWEEAGLAWSIGESTLAAEGLTVLRTPAGQLREDPHGVIRDLAAAFQRAGAGPRPRVTSIRSAASPRLI